MNTKELKSDQKLVSSEIKKCAIDKMMVRVY